GQGHRALDDAAAQHARLPLRRIVEHTGLPRRHAVLAGDEIDLDPARTAAEPGGVRRPGRAHLDVDLVPAGAERMIDRAFAEPVDVAQPHAARAQRPARADDDAPSCRVEPGHIERVASGYAGTAARAARATHLALTP